MSRSPCSILVPPTLTPSQVQPDSMPSPTATFLSHTNSYAETSPCTCLPAPAPCLELSFSILSQKRGSHDGGGSCRPPCQATLASEGLLGEKPEPPPSPASADKTRKTAADCHPRGAERRAEPGPGLGVHRLTVSLVVRALARSGDAVREMKWPGSEVRKPWVSGQVSLVTLTRVFSVGFFFSPQHIFPWLIAIKVCRHARNCWLLAGEICGFKYGFVGGCMRKHEHCGCAGLLRLPGRDCQHE